MWKEVSIPTTMAVENRAMLRSFCSSWSDYVCDRPDCQVLWG